MLWVKDNINEVLKKLNADSANGLKQDEVQARLQKYGLNEFEEEKKETLAAKILHHLSEIPTMILIAAALIAGYMAIFHPPDTIGSGWPKVIVILSIVVINVCLGFIKKARPRKLWKP